MDKKEPFRVVVRDRNCGTCTKCCEGYLSGEINGIPFYEGKPCHFVDIGSGCSIYEDRPEAPCRAFKCQWLSDPNYPEWLKPNISNVMFVHGNIGPHFYVFAKEAGGKMDARTLSWAINYFFFNKMNFAWQYDGGWNAIGTDEFIKVYFENERYFAPNSKVDNL